MTAFSMSDSSFTNPNELAEKMLDVLQAEKGSNEMGQKGKEHIQKYLLPEDLYMSRLIELWKNTVCAE